MIAPIPSWTAALAMALVLAPALDGRVLGYLRLGSAAPDVGHFASDAGRPE